MEIFKIRTYGRTELAQLYCPALCPQAAFRKLNQWIDFHPTLRHELHALVIRTGCGHIHRHRCG